MKFAPEYVTYVLNENFEDAKALLLSPLMAIHYAHLVMLTDPGDCLGQGCARAARRPRRDLAGRDPPREVRRHLRGPVLLHRAADCRGVRRRGRRPAAHRPLAQRHRHDDVPDAAAGAHSRPARGDVRAPRARSSTSSTATATTIFAVHTHTQRAQPTTVAHYLLAVVEQLERDGSRLKAAYDRTNVNPLGACAITGTGFPIDRRLTCGAARVLPADRQYLRQHRDGRLPAREHVGGGGAAGRLRPLRAGPAAVGHFRVRLRAASAMASCRAAASCPRSATRSRSSTHARSAARRSDRRRPSS